MAWVVAPNIKALFASVNKLAPNRDRASDGTVGDLAHQQGTSGHNPDDYPGVKAERSDSDSVAEVRAGDVDRDLNVASIPGDDMEVVVQTVVRTPALRRRLIYVIYNRRIWEASNGWRERPYTGPNPHDHHAHFSGHPDYDNDSSPWREIEALGADMTPEEHNWLSEVRGDLNAVKDVLDRWRVGWDTATDGSPIEPVKWEKRLLAFQLATTKGLADLAGRDLVDEQQVAVELAPAILAQLTPERIVAAIPQTLAKQVADELTARLAE